MNLYPYLNNILQTELDLPEPTFAGRSRQRRFLPAYKFGTGDFLISLIGGCHADEPTGPRLLKKLVSFLSTLPESHPLLSDMTWYIVPHVNPDGESINKVWYNELEEEYDLVNYLKYKVRELPGDDLEYGFPIAEEFPALRPENQFVYDFWKTAAQPFHLHASLHGMGWSNGPWFLLDKAWQSKSSQIIEECTARVEELGYDMFDVERNGEKGFSRITRGFSTRPDSESMRKFFLEKGDSSTAARFHPSSMESIRSFGGDCLTLVTEMPLFIYPTIINSSDWPNPDFERWNLTLAQWTSRLISGDMKTDEFKRAAARASIRPMPVKDQMNLQWQYISSGVETAYKAAIT